MTRKSKQSHVLPMIAGLLLLAATASAQVWTGSGRLSGVVLDENEKPIAGAEVRLILDDGSNAGPPPATTNRKGRWLVGGLAFGGWRLLISADGYINSEGWAQVGQGPAQPVRVVLRPISEVTAGFAENPSSVLAWLEKGNSLLEQGQTAAARAEYEKALRYLPPGEQPEVLRAVAHTHYLEGDAEKASDILRWSLVLAPESAETRQIFAALLGGIGRGEEAAAWLARLDAEGAEKLAEEIEPPVKGAAGGLPQAFRELDLDGEAPQAGRTGRYRVSFTERGDFSSLDVFLERTGHQRGEILTIDPEAAAYEMAEETFEVYVPEGGEGPYGLFVWVSPTSRGGLATTDGEGFKRLLDDRRLIWVGANNSSNARKLWDRMGLALDAVHNLRQLYPIDEERIYAGGYSGGGRTSTLLTVAYPEVFRGGFFVYGCDFYRDIPVLDKPGAVWPASFPPPPKERLKLVKKRNRYVFLTGEKDFNRAQTKAYSKHYEKEGFAHVTYIEIPGADHYTVPAVEFFGHGFTALDGG